MQNTLQKGAVYAEGNVVLVARTKEEKICIITADSVEELQADWDGKRKFFPENVESVEYASVFGREVKAGRPVLNAIEKIEDVVRNLEVNTQISYLYRDARNETRRNKAIVKGVATQKQIEIIMSCLHDGVYFIPEQVGLPGKRMNGYEYDPDMDTPFMELLQCGFSFTSEHPDINLSVEELVAAFQKAKNNWDATIDISW